VAVVVAVATGFPETTDDSPALEGEGEGAAHCAAGSHSATATTASSAGAASARRIMRFAVVLGRRADASSLVEQGPLLFGRTVPAEKDVRDRSERVLGLGYR